MAGYGIVSDVSASLVATLRDRIRERGDLVSVDPESVGLVSPTDIKEDSDVRIGLFLYDVTENPTMKNADRPRAGEGRYQDPPLALDLQYLVTAYPGTDDHEPTERSLDQQQVLGLAMQLLHDTAKLDPETLPGADDDETAPKVAIETEPLETKTGLWTTFDDVSFQPSVSFHVSPVLIESMRETETPEVSERETRAGRKPDPQDRNDRFPDYSG